MSTPFNLLKTFVDPTFFSKLSQHKLEEAKLDELSVPLYGFCSSPVTANKAPAMYFSSKSFESRVKHSTTSSFSEYAIPGHILNFNTIEAFKELDKVKFINDEANRIKSLIDSREIFNVPAQLLSFSLISYSDLKKYTYYYWFCFPSLPFECTILEVTQTHEQHLDRSIEEHQKVADDSGIFFALDRHNDHWKVKHLRSLKFGQKSATIGIVDFGSNDGLPWHLRNICSSLKPYFTHALVYVWRHRLPGFWVEIDLRSGKETQVLGWERNSKNKLAPKVTDIGALQNPLQLADEAVDLNLKLMKWRAAPQIDLEPIKNSKCLLLGAGTLGCYVARGLLAWGVRHITLVDSGKVSYSNPVRQPLFTLEDSKQQRPKAEAAAATLAEIFPGVTATGHMLEIPMAGHPISNDEHQHKDYEKLCQLIDAHDVVYLLMDSRESRWLPTVICQAKEKLVINVAIGFDSFLVMRHGIRGQKDRLGCYFCNDVVAPIDSISRLSLDQMCTVTRPGVAMLAGAEAVELLATIYQCPTKGKAPHVEETILGKASHQLRGFVAKHQTMDIWGPAFSHCSACSDIIVSTWQEKGWDFVTSALDDEKHLTELSGLGKLQRATDELADDLELSEDDDDLV